MATIMGGLFVATFLTLLFVPALYALLWNRRSLREQGDLKSSPAVLFPLPGQQGEERAKVGQALLVSHS